MDHVLIVLLSIFFLVNTIALHFDLHEDEFPIPLSLVLLFIAILIIMFFNYQLYPFILGYFGIGLLYIPLKWYLEVKSVYKNSIIELASRDDKQSGNYKIRVSDDLQIDLKIIQNVPDSKLLESVYPNVSEHIGILVVYGLLWIFFIIRDIKIAYIFVFIYKIISRLIAYIFATVTYNGFK